VELYDWSIKVVQHAPWPIIAEVLSSRPIKRKKKAVRQLATLKFSAGSQQLIFLVVFASALNNKML